MLPKLLSGFDEDCKSLIIQFEKEGCSNFSIFCSIWRSMNFTLIFSGRTAKEVVHFTSEALAYLKNFFFHSKSFLRKICCIYLIYGIYYKQPIENYCKISLTNAEWILLNNFMYNLKQNNHLEAICITLKLIFDDAFQFCILSSKRMTPVPTTGKYLANSKEITEEQMIVESLKIAKLLDELKGVEEAYSASKQELKNARGIIDLDYSKDNLLETYETILNTNPEYYISRHENSEINESEESIANRRKEIKKKSYFSKTRGFRLNMVDIKAENEQAQ